MAEWKDALFLIKHQEIPIKMVGKETKINFKSNGRQKKSAPDKDLEFVSCNCKKADA